MNIKITEDCRRILGDYVLQSIDSINNADCKNNVDINKIRIPGIGASANQTNLLRIPKISDADYDSIKYIMESTGCHWRERYGGFVTYDTRDEFIQKVNLRGNIRRSCSHQKQCAMQFRQLFRRFPCVIFGRYIGKIAGFVCFVYDDCPYVRKRQEQGRARADDDRNFPIPRPFPLVDPFACG